MEVEYKADRRRSGLALTNYQSEAFVSRYRRYFVPGGTFFFTLVTEERAHIFGQQRARRLLGSMIRQCRQQYPIDVFALVLLPDHLHTIWILPTGDQDFSVRWNWIKGNFTRRWLASGGLEIPTNSARRREGRRGVWQRRFWEHTIRDEADLESHFDYIHYNPVKHGYVQRPRDWPWSTFHRWVAKGHYSIDWGAGVTLPELPGDAGE